MPWTAGSVLTASLLNTFLPQTWSAWVPTFTAGSGTFTSVSGSGRYLPMGRIIFYRVSVTVTTAGTAAGALRFTLPTAGGFASGHIGSGRETAVGGASLVVTQASTTIAQVVRYDAATPIATGSQIEVSGFYEGP